MPRSNEQIVCLWAVKKKNKEINTQILELSVVHVPMSSPFILYAPMRITCAAVKRTFMHFMEHTLHRGLRHIPPVERRRLKVHTQRSKCDIVIFISGPGVIAVIASTHFGRRL